MKQLLTVCVAIMSANMCRAQLATYIGRYVTSARIPGQFDEITITQDSFYATYFLSDPVRVEHASGYWYSDAGTVNVPIQIVVPSGDTTGTLWADLSKFPNLKVFLYFKGGQRQTVLFTESIINVPQLLVEGDNSVYYLFTKGMARYTESRAACNRALSVLMSR